MRNHKIDWTAAEAMIAGGVATAAVYVIALVVLFGPMAHALARLS